MSIHRISTEPPWSTRPSTEEELVLRGRTRDALWGFGQHPATSLCLSMLVGLYGERGPKPGRVLEWGSGSGLLCVAAAKLGARAVVGLEENPMLRELAAENARVNGATACSFPEASQVETTPFDLVIANLTAPELGAISQQLATLAPRGLVLMAGFVEEEREPLEQRMIGLGFRFLYREEREGFLASVLRARAADANARA